MRITEEQLNFLGSLDCHRLSSKENHRTLIKSFENSRNPNIVENLKKSAWQEDEAGSTAYYIIKTNNNIPLFFFSLKCGALSEHLDENQIKERKQIYDLAQRLISNPKDKKEEEMALLILEQFRSGNNLTDNEIKTILKKNIKNIQRKLSVLSMDKTKDPNKHIIRVANTHSGVELVHFCLNENSKSVWKSFNMPQSLGKIIFWYHIVPILKKVREVVGCKYLFLFAADVTEDGTLINYYNVDLKLHRPIDIGTTKPVYDLNCIFMCNEISSLISHRKTFFENFNPDSLVEVE